MVYIENEGAIFRGIARAFPTEVWSYKDKVWKEYKSEPKPIEWGNIIDDEIAKRMLQWNP